LGFSEDCAIGGGTGPSPNLNTEDLNASVSPTAIVRTITNAVNGQVDSPVVTPTNSSNFVVVSGYGSGYGSVAGGITVEVREGTTVLASGSFNGGVTGGVNGVQVSFIVVDETVAAHTYNMRITGNSSRNGTGFGIEANLIE